MVKKLYLFRHGETDWNKEFKIQGRTDNPLNKKGLQQASATALILQDRGIEYIYSSPLTRAIQTAEALKNLIDVNIQIVEDLIEGDFGSIEGLNSKDVENRLECQSINEGGDINEATGGESEKYMTERVLNAIIDICNSTPFDTIGISSHGHVLRNVLEACNFSDATRLKNCEVIEAEFTDGNLKIIGRIKSENC